MLNSVALLFLIAHVFADFYLQTAELADRKETEYRALIQHTLIYGFVFLAFALFVGIARAHWNVVLAAGLLFILHAVADLLKFALTRFSVLETQKALSLMYIADQAFHVGSIVAVMNRFRYVLPVPEQALRWTLLILLIHKPANVTFKKLLSKYEVIDAEKPDTLPGAGALIGTLERVLSAIFIGLGQYASIGLIYTAKSIARFKKIEENPKFAEYYLIGTLYSILFVLVSYQLIMNS